MATIFNEDNTIEQMMLSTLQKNGWKYIPAEELPRMYSDVLVEPMVKEALIRLNPEIAEDPSRADEVIYKLRTLILSVQPHNLVTQNEIFKKMIFEENSYPFGKDGRMVPIRFFGTMRKEDLALNEYVVTNQWIYPQAEGGKRMAAAAYLLGENDFASFCGNPRMKKSTVRLVDHIAIERRKDRVVFTFHGTGFLQNMVRIMVGTLLEVGRGYWTPEHVRDILSAKDRKQAGPTAPPEGLCLMKVDY